MLEDGRTVPEAEARYLAPVDPSKIIAVHLTYQSRLTEYAARTPAVPVVLHEAADHAQRPPRRSCAARAEPDS